jgi:hypothetical protein
MYLMNNARAGVSNRVDLDDWLSNRPGQAVRVDTDGPDVQGHFGQITTPPIGGEAMNTLEYFDKLRETRTGVMRYEQGLTSDAMHDTAQGVNQLLNQANKRKLLIARNFADGFKSANKKILRLVINHQDRERIIRLRNEWVPMSPKAWNADMDAKVKVGLGFGTKESQMQANRFIIELMRQVVELQGGIQGPILKGSGIYYVLKRTASDLGFVDPDQVWADPDDPQNQPQPQESAEDKLLRFQMQESQAKMALQEREFEAKIALEWEKFKADMEIKRADAQMKAGMNEGEIAQDRERFEQEMVLKREEFYADMELQREKFAAEIALEREKAAGDIELKRESATINAKLKHQESRAKAQAATKPAPEPKQEAPVINLNVEAPQGGKSFKVKRDSAGNLTGIEGA